MEGDHGEYYRNSLKYLGVIDLSKMNQAEQQSKAFSLGISALLASVSIAYSVKIILNYDYGYRMCIIWESCYNTKSLDQSKDLQMNG